MSLKRIIVTVGSAAALLGMLALGNPAVWAQEATPAADGAAPPRPVHIHSGNCAQLGDVVQPLNDLTEATGARVGQAGRAVVTQSSYTEVPLSLDAMLTADHAINAHLSAEEIGTYIACGDIGGMLTDQGTLIVGLREDSNSGFTGIAFLSPLADGAATGVSVFIAETQRGGRNRDAAAEATPAVGGEQTETADALPMATPEAGTAASEAMVAGDQVPVSLIEFAIDMPTNLPAGEVTFQIANDGEFTHSFEIENEAMEEELEPALEPGQSGTLTVNLEPGTYTVYCPVGNHREQGMEIQVTVA
jgi:uncharacterized cupredoxin-like copper-binding protein